MGAKEPYIHLTRRERQILDIIFAMGEASAAQVREKLPDPPGDASVRKLLSLLEEKGHLKHRQVGPRYVYSPTTSPGRARKSALRHVMDTFFSGEPDQVMVALLDMESGNLTDEQVSRIQKAIEEARKEGR